MDVNKQDVSASLSPALTYEQMLLETCRDVVGRSEPKMIIVFKVLDQIMPHLGVFAKLMQRCRDELFQAVYSDEYTANPDPEQAVAVIKDADKYIQKVPFFQLVKQVHDQRDERNEQLTEKLELVEEKLLNKQQQFLNATGKIAELEEDIRNLKKNICDLEADIKDKGEQISELQETLAQDRQSAAEKEHQLSCDIAELQENLANARADIAFLQQYKQGYDDLEQAFVNRVDNIEFDTQRKGKPVIASKRTHLVSGIENCNKMELQLLTMQNSNIGEFDKFLEDQKTSVLEKSVDDPRELEMHDIEMELAQQQLQVKQDRFQATIQDLNSELKLLRQHRLGLVEQLQVLEQTKQAKRKKDKSPNRPTTRESTKSLTHDLETTKDEEEEEGTLDPFAIQERVFSKFAAMLYTSENGKTYHEFKGAKYCQSCGEKTVLCPHKILQQEHTFLLPPNISHIKIIRPKVRINANLVENAMPGPKGLSEKSSVSPNVAVAASHMSISMMAMGDGFTPAAQSISVDLNLGADSTHYHHTIHRLWEDYRSRTDQERIVARPLSCSHALSLLEQFSAHILWMDLNHREDEEPLHILDSLYEFLVDRYLTTDMAYLTAYDFIMALTDSISSNKLIWLFVQTLIGNLDACVLRYILLIGDFVNMVEWSSVEDFRVFASLLYPTLSEDDLETLQMGYVSFSENKISKSLVADYIIYMIIKYREPRFLDMENALLAQSGHTNGVRTEPEFIEATDMILDVPDNKLRKWLYGESLAYVQLKDDSTAVGVPNLRLAQVCSYLQLLHISSVVKENIRGRIETLRQRVSDAQDGDPKVPVHSVPPQFKVVGLSDVMNIADNTSRRSKFRT